jgi:hypothetical protein
MMVFAFYETVWLASQQSAILATFSTRDSLIGKLVDHQQTILVQESR